jgi:hypothetical protein
MRPRQSAAAWAGLIAANKMRRSCNVGKDGLR